MGQAANLGLTIGVLTGVGAHRDLVDADIIVQVILKSRGVYKQNTRYGYRLNDFFMVSVEMTDMCFNEKDKDNGAILNQDVTSVIDLISPLESHEEGDHHSVTVTTRWEIKS